MQPTYALNPRARRYPGYPSPIFPPTSTTPIVRCPSVFKLRQTPHSHSHYPKAAIGHPSYLQGQVRSILPVTFASPKPYPYIHRLVRLPRVTGCRAPGQLSGLPSDLIRWRQSQGNCACSSQRHAIIGRERSMDKTRPWVVNARTCFYPVYVCSLCLRARL